MMPKGELSPEGEVIKAYGAAMVAAFQVLINCLEESDGPESFRLQAKFFGAVGLEPMPGSHGWTA
jgi:hypothetical protein